MLFLKKFGPRISHGVLKLVRDPGYKKNVQVTKKSIKKRKKIYQQESILEKNVGLGIVVVCISWPGHPDYKKKIGYGD